MRVRHFPISSEAVGSMLTTGAEICLRVASGLPEDAKVRGAFTEDDKIVLVVESRQFEDVPADRVPPLHSLLLEDRLPLLKAARASMRGAAAA